MRFSFTFSIKSVLTTRTIRFLCCTNWNNRHHIRESVEHQNLIFHSRTKVLWLSIHALTPYKLVNMRAHTENFYVPAKSRRLACWMNLFAQRCLAFFFQPSNNVCVDGCTFSYIPWRTHTDTDTRCALLVELTHFNIWWMEIYWKICRLIFHTVATLNSSSSNSFPHRFDTISVRIFSLV